MRGSKQLRNPTSWSDFPIDFSSPTITNVYSAVRLKKKLRSASEAQRWPSWQHWSWWTILLDSDINAVPEPKNRRVKGYRYSLNQLQTSPTPTLTRKKVQHAWYSLYSMPSLHTVWCSNQCRDLCLAYCCATLRHLHTSGTCSRLKECNRQPCTSATVQKCQCGCEFAGGEEALPDLVHYIYYHRIVKSWL